MSSRIADAAGVVLASFVLATFVGCAQPEADDKLATDVKQVLTDVKSIAKKLEESESQPRADLSEVNQGLDNLSLQVQSLSDRLERQAEETEERAGQPVRVADRDAGPRRDAPPVPPAANDAGTGFAEDRFTEDRARADEEPPLDLSLPDVRDAAEDAKQPSASEREGEGDLRSVVVNRKGADGQDMGGMDRVPPGKERPQRVTAGRPAPNGVQYGVVAVRNRTGKWQHVQINDLVHAIPPTGEPREITVPVGAVTTKLVAMSEFGEGTTTLEEAKSWNVQAPDYRQPIDIVLPHQVQRPVSPDSGRMGKLVIRNQTGSWQIVRVNGQVHRIPPGDAPRELDVPAGEVTTQLLAEDAFGQLVALEEARQWTIGAPDFSQPIDIVNRSAPLARPIVYLP